MFPIISIPILAFFAIDDYYTQTSETKWILLFFLMILPLKIITGTIIQSTIIAITILLIMLILQRLKITYTGDTLVITLITFINPNPFIILGALTIGSVIVSFSKQKRTGFIPYFLIGYLLTFLTFNLILV